MKCSKCKRDKPRSEFWGDAYWCRDCVRKARDNDAYRAAMAERQRRRRAQQKENV
jgi:hypothetical protein